MANKYLTASGAFATSGDNAKVYKITAGCNTIVGSVELKQGGSAGSTVWGMHIPISQSGQIKVPGIVADYATIVGTNPHVTIEFNPAKV